MSDQRLETCSVTSSRANPEQEELPLTDPAEVLVNMQRDHQEMISRADMIRREPENYSQQPERVDDRRRMPTRKTTSTRHRHDRVETPEIVDDQLHDRHGFFRQSKLPSPGYIGQARREMHANVPQHGTLAHNDHRQTQEFFSRNSSAFSPPLNRHRSYPTATSTPPVPVPGRRVASKTVSAVPYQPSLLVNHNLSTHAEASGDLHTSQDSRTLSGTDGIDRTSNHGSWDSNDLALSRTYRQHTPPNAGLVVRPDTVHEPIRPQLSREVEPRINRHGELVMPLAAAKAMPKFSDLAHDRNVETFVPVQHQTHLAAHDDVNPPVTPVRDSTTKHPVNFADRLDRSQPMENILIVQPVHRPPSDSHADTAHPLSTIAEGTDEPQNMQSDTVSLNQSVNDGACRFDEIEHHVTRNDARIDNAIAGIEQLKFDFNNMHTNVKQINKNVNIVNSEVKKLKTDFSGQVKEIKNEFGEMNGDVKNTLKDFMKEINKVIVEKDQKVNVALQSQGKRLDTAYDTIHQTMKTTKSNGQNLSDVSKSLIQVRKQLDEQEREFENSH